MQSLQDTDLLEIAQAVVTPEQQSYHEELLAKNALDELKCSNCFQPGALNTSPYRGTVPMTVFATRKPSQTKQHP
jgi:hypothetical protein